MDNRESWRDVFSRWPEAVPRRGVVINNFNDSIPFKAFMTTDALLLLERTTPDALGGRFAILPYDMITTLKFTDPLKESAFTALGFKGKLAQA